MYRAEPYLKGTSAPNRYLLSEKSASKGGGEGFKKSQQKTDFFNFDSFPKCVTDILNQDILYAISNPIPKPQPQLYRNRVEYIRVLKTT